MARALIATLALALATPALAQTAPKIIIVGDSTAAEHGPERYPRQGWGQVLRCTLVEGSTVLNLAKGGRSTKSFIVDGFFSDMVRQVQPGDTVLIQFGHNDSAVDRPERYTDPAIDFRDNLRAYVTVVRAKGGQPVLITPVQRRRFDSGRFTDVHVPYAEAVREVAVQMRTPLIDLSAVSLAWLERVGGEGSKAYFIYQPPGRYPAYPEGATDDTHFSELGARTVAAMVADSLRRTGIPAATMVRPNHDPEAPVRVLGNDSCG